MDLNNHTWLAATILGSTGLGNKVQRTPEHTVFRLSLYVSSVKQYSTCRFLNTVYYLTAHKFLSAKMLPPYSSPFQLLLIFHEWGKIKSALSKSPGTLQKTDHSLLLHLH